MKKNESFSRRCRNAFLPLIMLMLIPQVLLAQETTNVSGTVLDQTGSPLPGVTVVVTGTTTGTITDIDGNFKLEAPVGSTVTFSFVGMNSQVMDVTANMTVLSITMMDQTTDLDQVVVTGYSSMRKADLTGAVEVVKMESIENVSLSSGNPMQALQGRVPGLYIEKTGSPTGSNSRILIRGVNTLGDNNPLYIIDGVPTKRTEVFQGISPGSIVSVQVLKDASASSIYGSRASNGVVIVTTKNGSNNDGKVKIQFNSNLSIQSEKRQRFDMLNAADRGRALWQASVNDGVDPASGYGEIYNFDWNGDFNNPVLNSVTVQPYVGGDTNVPVGDTDWQDVMYQPGYVINNDLTISGGDENSSVLLNLGYIKNTGMLKYTDYDRITSRLNAQTSMFEDRLKVGINTTLVTSNETLETPDLGSAPTPGLAVTLAPTIPVYTNTGEYAGPLGSGYSDRNNPLHMQYINRWDNTKRSYLFGNVFAELKLIKDLTFKTNVGIDYSLIKDKDIEPAFTEGFIARAVNNMTQTNSDLTSVTWSNTLNYKLDVDNHRFRFLLGVESVEETFNSITAYKENFATQTEEYFVFDAGTTNGNSFGNSTKNTLFSQFGKIDYTFSDKYLASFTLRRDGSSKFGEDNRFGYFPAATFGWRLTEENFMENVEVVSNLKFRAGWGRVGNQDIGNFASLGLFESRYGTRASDIDGFGHVGFFDQYWNIGSAYDLTGSNSGNLASGFVSVQAANPGVRWETTEEINLGLDFGLWGTKVVGSFDYFTRETSDILIQPPVASAVGEGQKQWLNGATQENKGWELALSYHKAKEDKGDLSYTLTVTGSHFKDKITKLPEEVRTAYPGNAEKDIIGHSALSIFGYETDGIFNNQAEVDAHATQVGAAPGRIRYKDLNDDGKIDALDQDFLGTTLPDLEYSIKIDVDYKNFDLSIFGSGVAGKTGFDPYVFYNDFIRGRDNVGPGVFDAWTAQNPNSSVPALSLSDANNETRSSDYFNVNASYFKLRNLQLGYTFKQPFVEKIKLEKLRVYFMADNLFWIDSKDFKGPDPERLDVNTIPVPTTYSFGVNVSL
ncbi:SusC/RagA family TonB-linked outer membrane protein [Saccharicrinis sp. 156]|uniref:SusC/RagA family TonB-linked outer membrane protein n=1 Tax=Saccharicrinis sp. 156 TaxID=3417574 RepID=UPI003D329356